MYSVYEKYKGENLVRSYQRPTLEIFRLLGYRL